MKVMLDRVRIDSDAVSVKLREVLAWDAAVAMAVTEMDSSIQKPHIGIENEAGSGSTEK